jgi:hypothetical protein
MFADLREWCLSFYTFRTGAGPPGDRWKCPIPLPGHDPACVGTWFRRGTYICDARGASHLVLRFFERLARRCRVACPAREALAAVIPRSTLACLRDHSGVAARKRWGEPRIFLREVRSVAPQPPPARLWEACAPLRHHQVGETSAGWPLHREGSTRRRSAFGVNNIARSHRYRRRGRPQGARLERRALTLRDAWRAPQD